MKAVSDRFECGWTHCSVSACENRIFWFRAIISVFSRKTNAFSYPSHFIYQYIIYGLSWYQNAVTPSGVNLIKTWCRFDIEPIWVPYLGSSAVFILNSTPTQLSWVIPWVGVLFCVLSWVGNVTQLVGSVGGLSQIPWQHALSTAQLPWKRHVTADDTVQNGGVPDGWQFLRYAAIGRLFLTAQEAKVG